MDNKEPNTHKGFYYAVTDEQIREHKARTPFEIFEWIESTLEFMWRFQTPEEKDRAKLIRQGKSID